MKLSLIFPAYNEAGSITPILEGFLHYGDARKMDYEIIVVNDGSRDTTSSQVHNLAGQFPSMRLIEHDTNQGYGAALRSGFAAATGDFIFFTDSDGQFSTEDLDGTLPLIDDHTIILGYRQRRAEGMVRRLNAGLWGRIVDWAIGVHVRDLNCAWKLFPRSLLTDVTLISQGAFISAELLYYARKKQFTFREIPVRHFRRRSGSPTGASGRVIWRAFRELASFLHHRARVKT